MTTLNVNEKLFNNIKDNIVLEFKHITESQKNHVFKEIYDVINSNKFINAIEYNSIQFKQILITYLILLRYLA